MQDLSHPPLCFLCNDTRMMNLVPSGFWPVAHNLDNWQYKRRGSIIFFEISKTLLKKTPHGPSILCLLGSCPETSLSLQVGSLASGYII